MFMGAIYKQCCSNLNNIRVLDLCGAPGGKSTHLSALIGGNGFLVANEVIRSRASILAENITKWGLSNTLVTRNDPAAFAGMPGYFDLILVDAPCSGEGMFRDQVAITEWSEENAEICAARQKRILTDVWPALKEGGVMIYSTCTMNPAENEENMRWFLNNQEAESVRLDISDYEGITEIDHHGIFGYGFYPGMIKGEGLFISVIRKTGSEEDIKIRFKSDKSLAVSTEEKRVAGEWTSFGADSLIKNGADILALPCSIEDYSLISLRLSIVKKGTKIITMKGKDLLPSHDLAMSVYLRNSVFHTLNLDVSEALSYLCRENIAADAPAGWLISEFRGVNLGFMKNVGNRINNYYPVDWRIRMRITEKKLENIIDWKV